MYTKEIINDYIITLYSYTVLVYYTVKSCKYVSFYSSKAITFQILILKISNILKGHILKSLRSFIPIGTIMFCSDINYFSKENRLGRKVSRYSLKKMIH